MKNKKANKSIIAVSLSLGFVLLFVIMLFLLGQKDNDKSEILLPDAQIEPSNAAVDHASAQDNLLQINKDNVISALKSIERPDYYHQTYDVEVGTGANVRKTQIEVWNNGDLKCGHIISDASTKFVLTNGDRVWIWYSNETRTMELSLQAEITFEDLLGLPGFQYVEMLENSQIISSEYLLIGDGDNEVSCVFLDTQEGEQTTNRFWINLENGLMYRADSVEQDTPVYHVEQVSFDLLVDGDEAFAEIFVLPDGTRITTEET